jgi:hypothetical protein
MHNGSLQGNVITAAEAAMSGQNKTNGNYLPKRSKED